MPVYLTIWKGVNIYMKIALACDHGGFVLMGKVKAFLDGGGFQIRDFGTFSQESCDYPEFAIPASRAVAAGEYDKGILICTTGIGMSIVANKVPGIRAALCTDTHMAEMTRRHNDANILCLGADITEAYTVVKIIDVFLKTDFQGGKHARRIGLISSLEAMR
jgi:ribose 5-phosphate isomerase B